ncbi:ankyrin repeat domain-containing protein 63-like [Ambystoma mexicanum]|uniref:ankyrin repeat domain-containing protein 63-like n=1 Tax=Ambystoma mexicanum TaxID=8296 RepID=UPI0037E80CD6
MLEPSEEPGGGGEERRGARALLDAMSNDQLHLTRFLLDAQDGRLADAEAGRGERTPLAAAALLPESTARARFLQLLIERGAAVDARDSWGRTALSYACERGHLDAVRRLVQAGADPDLTDAWGNTALQYAAVAGHAPTVAFLVRAFKRLGGLEVHRPNRAGNSALGLARALGHEECVRVLTGGRAREVEYGPAGRGHTIPQEEGPNAHHGALSGRAPHRSLLPRFQSMHSIEEEERGAPGTHPSPLPPRTRSWSLQYGSSAAHLPRLPSTDPSAGGRPCGAGAVKGLPALPGHLGILLTPLPPVSPRVAGGGGGLCGFNASYYQKRSSLPSTSMLAPTTTESTPPNTTEAPPRAGPHPPGTLALLGSKLMRRFTFPEFRKPGRTPQVHSGQCDQPPGPGERGMARSESFPLSRDHPQVASKPSIDSISAVQCEFDPSSQS